MIGVMLNLVLADIMCMDGNQLKDLHLDLKIRTMLLCLNYDGYANDYQYKQKFGSW
jgi:hypothetical protein